MRAKRIGIILISLLLIADISGCENLKKKDALPAAKTEESEVYHGFDDLNQDDPKTAQESVLKENGMVCAGGKIEAGEKNWEKFRKQREKRSRRRSALCRKSQTEHLFTEM